MPIEPVDIKVQVTEVNLTGLDETMKRLGAMDTAIHAYAKSWKAALDSAFAGVHGLAGGSGKAKEIKLDIPASAIKASVVGDVQLRVDASQIKTVPIVGSGSAASGAAIGAMSSGGIGKSVTGGKLLGQFFAGEPGKTDVLFKQIEELERGVRLIKNFKQENGQDIVQSTLRQIDVSKQESGLSASLRRLESGREDPLAAIRSAQEGKMAHQTKLGVLATKRNFEEEQALADEKRKAEEKAQRDRDKDYKKWSDNLRKERELKDKQEKQQEMNRYQASLAGGGPLDPLAELRSSQAGGAAHQTKLGALGAKRNLEEEELKRQRDIDQAKRNNEAARLRRQRQQEREDLNAKLQDLPQSARDSIASQGLSPDRLRRAIRSAQVEQKDIEGNRFIGRNLLSNVAHVTAWSAAVGTLYGSLRLLKNAMQANVAIEYQEARLMQVLQAGREEQSSAVKKLTSEVLAYAAAYGRTTEEAMQSAVQWSRLGLNRVQVAEAVRISLMAANVAEISAAEATTHLSSIMAVYGLRVSELHGVLGGLNQISNEYNVTNNDLLTGLTKTAAIAKQAGIGLFELMGILGSGVGKTGQTGAQIGNAVKSIIGALDTADKQGILRKQFNVELSNDGTPGIQNMSAALAELFVQYQRMNDEERRSMLFSVAGRNQASRMAAILDNYVKGQILAINAQLNLNSADKENALITATMKSNMQGLVTEFEKFSRLQMGSKFGPTGFLNEAAKGLRNALHLANTGPGSVITQGVGMLAAAVTARTALSAFTMPKPDGQKMGVIGNTAKAMQNAWQDVGRAMNETVMRGSLILNDIAGKGALAADSMNKLSAGAKLVRISMATLGDVVIPMLLLWGTLKAINFTMEKLGLSSSAAEDRFQGFVRNAQSLEAMANAKDMRARLIGTLRRTLDKTTDQTNRESLLEQMSGGLGFNDKQKKEWIERAKALDQNADKTKLKTMLDQAQAKEEFDRNQARMKSWQVTQKGIESNEKEIERLKNSPFNRQDKIAELEGQNAESRAKQYRGIAESMEDAEHAAQLFRDTSTAWAQWATAQQGALSASKDLWDQLPGDTHINKLQKTIGYYNQVREVSKKTAEEATQELSKMGASSESPEAHNARAMQLAKDKSAAEDAISKRFGKETGVYQHTPMFGPEYRIGTLTGDMSVLATKTGLNQPPGGYRNLSTEEIKAYGERYTDNPKVKAFIDEINKMESQYGADSLKLMSTEKSPDKAEFLRQKRQQAWDQEKEANKKLSESVTQMPMAEMYDRNNMLASLNASRIGSYAFGDGFGGQFKNQYNSLRSNRYQVEGDTPEMANQRALQDRVKLADMEIEGRKKLVELETERYNLAIEINREYQRGLLTSSSGDLLRKLAIGNKANMSAGEFFSMDQASRQDWMARFSNSRMNQINRDIGNIRSTGVGNGTDAQAINVQIDHAKLRASLYEALKPPTDLIMDSAKIAATKMADVFNFAGSVVEAFANRIQGLLPNIAGNSTPINTQAPAQASVVTGAASASSIPSGYGTNSSGQLVWNGGNKFSRR